MAQAGTDRSARFGIRALVTGAFLLALAGLVAGLASRQHRMSGKAGEALPRPAQPVSALVEGGI
jgi:hypothetical protein